jgi:hypothetical protein
VRQHRFPLNYKMSKQSDEAGFRPEQFIFTDMKFDKSARALVAYCYNGVSALKRSRRPSRPAISRFRIRNSP